MGVWEAGFQVVLGLGGLVEGGWPGGAVRCCWNNLRSPHYLVPSTCSRWAHSTWQRATVSNHQDLIGGHRLAIHVQVCCFVLSHTVWQTQRRVGELATCYPIRAQQYSMWLYYVAVWLPWWLYGW